MSELNGRKPARAGGAIAGGLIVLALVVVAANAPRDPPAVSTPANAAAPKAEVQAENSFPPDKIQYDPESARKLELSKIVNVDTEYCVDQYVRNLLRNGDLSREHIAQLVGEKCSQEIIHNGLMPADDAVAGVKVQAYTAMEDIIPEGQ